MLQLATSIQFQVKVRDRLSFKFVIAAYRSELSLASRFQVRDRFSLLVASF